MPTYQPPRWQPPRKHGLQLPLSRDQLGGIIVYPPLTAAFYLICSYYVPKEYLPHVLGIYTALVVVAVACWFYVSLTDPAKPGGISCWCMRQTQSHSRYCASCRKSVPGLDHHCLWLNTCIGTRNYFFFFLLAVTGTLQFALQTAISVLLLTHWLHTAPSVQRAIDATVGSQKGYKAFMILHAVFAAIAFLSFSSLCVFHAYLQGVGMGTYDWILSKRAPATATATVAAPRSAAGPVSPAAPAVTPVAVASGSPGKGGNGNGNGNGNDGAPEHVAVSIPPTGASALASAIEMVAPSATAARVAAGQEGGGGNGMATATA